MQANISKIKSCYFNNSGRIVNKSHLKILMSSILLLNGCGSEIKKSPTVLNNDTKITENALNLNTAAAHELEKLPHVGDELAKKIIEHREKYGKFRRVEHLILVRGMSDKKFRQLQNLIKAE